MLRRIPQVHKLNDPEYWISIYPNKYKNRTITIMDWQENVPEEFRLQTDGDIRFEVENGKHIPYCNCCNKQIRKFKPKMFGSLDVGYELVYHCDNCEEGTFRIYSPNYLVEKYIKVGIVFGCFIPLHDGHKYIIDQATNNNDIVIIGVCGKDNDRGKDFIPFKDRLELMKKIYTKPKYIVVPVDDEKLKLDGSFSYDNWVLWGNELFTNADVNPDHLYTQFTWYTGEPSYTEKLSAIYKSHKFVTFDRNVISISGTKIRQNLNDNLQYVDDTFIEYLKTNKKSI